MKQKITKKLYIDTTLDSSEAIMFNKGGRHSISIKPVTYDEYGEPNGKVDFNSFDEILFSVQMERSEQSRFDFISNEAQNHRKQWDKINREEQSKPTTLEASSNL